MRKFLLITAVLFACTVCYAQKDSSPGLLHIDNDKLSKQIDSSMKQMDSINERINNSFKSMDSVYMKQQLEQNNRNLDQFMAMQREREAKQKRSNWIRLGIGVLFLGVLIFGWMRRRKKASQIN